jgi:hypothetical protein
MLETAKRLLQLGRRPEEGQEAGEPQEARRKRRSLVQLVLRAEEAGPEPGRRKKLSLAQLVLSPSRLFTEEPKLPAEEQEGPAEEAAAPRLFTAHKSRSRRLSLRGGGRAEGPGPEGEREGRGRGNHLSCPDLSALQEEGRAPGRAGRLVARLRGRAGARGQGAGGEVDTVDSNTATVFGSQGAVSPGAVELIDINFE